MGCAGRGESLSLRSEQGTGVAVDRDEALRWYRKAAAVGNAQAASRLAELGG